jgi:hypothetical protein
MRDAVRREKSFRTALAVDLADGLVQQAGIDARGMMEYVPAGQFKA